MTRPPLMPTGDPNVPSRQADVAGRLPRTVAGMEVLPAVHPRPGLPSGSASIEVGPRDGLQAEKAVVPLPVKLQLIDRLAAAGLAVIEATSFVSPRWVPQLADADELMAALRRRPGVRYPVLVPNEQGFERALAAGADELAIFVSATESFAEQNLGTTLDGAIEMAAPVVTAARGRRIPVRGYVSMCFGDPWEGHVDPGRPADVAARLVELGCSTISLGDTIGVATPGQVVAVLERTRCSRSSAEPDCAAPPRHLRPGSGKRSGRSGGWSSRVRLIEPGDSAVARTRNRRLAIWRPRIWCGCSMVLASRPA